MFTSFLDRNSPYKYVFSGLVWIFLTPDTRQSVHHVYSPHQPDSGYAFIHSITVLLMHFTLKHIYLL